MTMTTIPKSLLAAFALMACGAAQAVNTEKYDLPYVNGGGLFELGDSARDSDNGMGFSLGFGMPISSQPGTALEFSFSGIERDRDFDGESDYQNAIFGAWVRDIDVEWIAGARPFFLVGAGAVQEDVQGDDHIHFGLDGGLGALFPLPFRGWAIRAEARAQGQLNDRSVADEDYLLDFNFRLGLQVPLSWEASEPEAAPPPERCETRVVDPVTGRADCIADSDRDGIADGADQCPSTPGGVAVDAVGCPITGVVDSDGDGVVDGADACPGTTSGMIVDGTGCLVEQTITLKAVNFEIASAVMTSDARIALDEVARTLKNQPSMSVEISGHTDDAGNDNFNLALSQQRAESVRQYLIGKGVSADRLIALGMGESVPVADNTTEEGRLANRRVEFKVIIR